MMSIEEDRPFDRHFQQLILIVVYVQNSDVNTCSTDNENSEHRMALHIDRLNIMSNSKEKKSILTSKLIRNTFVRLKSVGRH